MSALQDVTSKATASAEMEMRVNLGNYEHAIVKHTLTDVQRSNETVEQLSRRVVETVEDIVTEKYADAKGSASK